MGRVNIVVSRRVTPVDDIRGLFRLGLEHFIEYPLRLHIGTVSTRDRVVLRQNGGHIVGYDGGRSGTNQLKCRVREPIFEGAWDSQFGT